VSYIDKNSNIVISARMTDMGRAKLSVGELNFNTFKLGDSEVDYNTLGSTYDVTLENILRAKAWQPKAKTWLLPTPNDPIGAVGIPSLTELEVGSIISSPEIGFFSTGNTSGTTIITSFTADTTDNYTLNEAIINLSDLDGTSLVTITTGTTSSSYEPLIGDLMMVKYSNPDLTDPQIPNTIDLTVPVPYLFYRVQATTGTLTTNTLQITADRNFPDFSSYVGSNTCDVIFYPNNSGTTSTDFTTGLYSGGSVWNMNNVWSNNMAGIQTGYEGFTKYGSEGYVGTKEFLGYTSQLSGSCEINKAISIIHYTNTEDCDRQSELTYGQQLYLQLALNETPILKVPTLMWHRSSGTTIGQTFSGTGLQKYVKQGLNNTDIRYFDLADEQGYTVGRIFPDQHLFTIDDDELVAGLSYKSNRNWTLPKLNLGLKSSNDGLVNNINDLHVTYLFNNTSSGFTAGLHSQYHTCIKIDEVVDSEGNSCGDGQTKDVEVTFPLSQLPFMKTSGGTGWYADEFIILVQKVVTGQRTTTNGWYAIDFTSLIGNPAGSHTVGNKINPLDLEASTFVITKALYDTAVSNGDKYDIHDYINIPTTSESATLQFGDERFFYGNVCASGITNKYRTKFNFVVPPTQWNTTNNPTWPGSGQNPHISEVIIQDTGGNVVAVGKQNLPIEKTTNTTIIIEIAFDM
jgi:hypothetical protein